MRIVIDLQGAQSTNRDHSSGRFSLDLALGVARNPGGHEVWLLLNSAMPEAIPAIRQAFDGLIPQERIRLFDVPAPLAAANPRNDWRTDAAQQIREYVIGQIEPDAVLVTSVLDDDAVSSIGAFGAGADTAVMLHDLSALGHTEAPASGEAQRQYDAHKIDVVRRACLVLTVSAHARQHAVDALGLDPARVLAISSGTDAARCDPDAALAVLQERFALRGKIVLYPAGNVEPRKNAEGLITAYGMLPGALRAGYQLFITGRCDAGETAQLRRHAARAGLAGDELLLTDAVDDDTVAALSSAAELVVLPSAQEDFGLVAREALARGALVIGSDHASLRECLGSAEATFDAADTGVVAARLAAVLTDPALQQRLRESAGHQLAKSSWEASAARVVQALEALASRTGPVGAPTGKRRLAFVSPLPPEQTGIADYAAQCLPALSAYFDIELITSQARISLPAELAHMPLRDVAWFKQHAGSFDQVIYQFGNSPFHSHMFALLAQYPGVVVLHDFYLSNVLAYEQMTGGMPRAWIDALYHSHGYRAVEAALKPADAEQAMLDYPCNLAVLQEASAVIVHSSHAHALARQWYGPDAGRNWHVVPLPRSAPAALSRTAARQSRGIAPGAFVVCSFGFVDGRKLSHRLLEAWCASSLAANPACELVFVGANHGGAYGRELLDTIKASGVGQRVRITGWTDDTVYREYLQAADVGVQLRSESRGETSAAVLDCMNYGLATIANANGSMAALPDDAIWKLDDDFALSDLVEALETLQRDSERRLALGARAAALIAQEQRPEHSAAAYATVLEQAWREAHSAFPALLRTLGESVPDDEQSRKELARCLALAPQQGPQPRQLLVDVTTIVRSDLGTGIERVVRMQLLELLRHKHSGFRVEPVYLSEQKGRRHYRYAQHYACKLLGIAPVTCGDAEIDISPGDVFYAPDYAPTAAIDAAQAGIYAHWRARGVSVNFMIHDLLPVLNPEFFPPGSGERHAAWLACLVANADRLLCISAAVANEMRTWMSAHLPQPARLPSLHVVHHGAGIAPTAVPSTPSVHDAALLATLAASPSVLMVGTIEPRKGHLQTLAGFEQLWREGSQVKLVIVGNEGWKPLPDGDRRTIPTIVARLSNHPELGKRLFWLKGIDDALLHQVYQACACLMASSEGEGFGLPLIEAAHYRLPIIARDIPVFREVAGDSAFYFNGADAAPLAAAVREWLDLRAAGSHPRSETMAFKTWRENVETLLTALR